MKTLYDPWPWYLAGPIIGIVVPLLLLVGNKRLGVSSTLRHLCAACLPTASLPLFQYNWKKEIWSLYFVAGILIGGVIAGYLFANPAPVEIAPDTILTLRDLGAEPRSPGLLPEQFFSWSTLLTLKGFLLIVVGGFLVGFGTRYAQGCTSGHGIFGLATFQWPSLVAIACFFVGGIIFSHLVLPWILRL
ncbi:MAG TPA: YeeE/YedE thiosulfate transporter family protein [Chryseosolibacter sp.]|nr:YeeE/YedE thiosulfate transporter family protein [Chryseosolibacter sp.]